MQSNDNIRRRGGGGGSSSGGGYTSPSGSAPRPPPPRPGQGYGPTSSPPPPPFGGAARSAVPSTYSPQQSPNARVAQIPPPQQQSYASSPYKSPQPATRPAYNYAAPSGPSAGGNYGGYAGANTSTSTGGSYGGYQGSQQQQSSGGYAFATNNNGNNRRDMDDNKYGKKKKKSKRNSSGASGSNDATIVLGAGLAFTLVYGIVMTILFMSYKGKTSTMLRELDQPSVQAVVNHAQELKHRLVSTERQLNRAKQETSRSETQKIATLQKENRVLQKETDDLKRKYESREATQAQTKLQERDMAFSEQVEYLMAVTRRESKRTVLERFGPGPHQVEVTYAIGDLPQPDVEDTRQRYNFIVELAPLDLVPHAVHLFLEQVEHGLLNGTWFYLNGPHIVQAGPQLEEEDPNFEYDESKMFDGDSKITNVDGDMLHVAAAKSLKAYSKASDDEKDDGDDSDYYAEEDRRMSKFAQLGLDKLAFPDYSHDYPHQPWTLGYTGRPGGPDFYINKVDNTKGHGPGGQHQHALSEQGDSCFGRIIAGQGRDDLARHLFGAQIYQDRSEWHYFLKSPVQIVGATVLTNKPQVVNINMGTPLHRGDFIKKNDGRPAEEQFGDELDSALAEQPMDPAESDPTIKDDAAAASESEEAKVETKEEVAAEEKKEQAPKEQEGTKPLDKKDDKKYKTKRKPRRPRIDGATEA